MGKDEDNTFKTNFLRKNQVDQTMKDYMGMGQHVVPVEIVEVFGYIPDCSHDKTLLRKSYFWEWCHCRTDFCNFFQDPTIKETNSSEILL